jgi:hypothetical protein
LQATCWRAQTDRVRPENQRRDWCMHGLAQVVAITARKRDFARLAASAASFCCVNLATRSIFS